MGLPILRTIVPILMTTVPILDLLFCDHAGSVKHLPTPSHLPILGMETNWKSRKHLSTKRSELVLNGSNAGPL